MRLPVTERTWTVTIPLHRQYVLNANDRHSHWSQRSEPTKVLRQYGAMAARKGKIPRLEKAHIVAHVNYPPKARLRDVYNLYPTAKGLVDGMVDKRLGVGILPDDNDNHLIGPDMRRAEGTSGRPDWFTFTITVTEIE